MRSRIIRAIAAGLLIGTLLVAGAAPLAPPGTRIRDGYSLGQ